MIWCMPRYNPWAELARLTDWTLRIAPLPTGQYGECCWHDQVITLAPGMTTAHRRTVLAHELRHVARGPFPAHRRAAEEAACDREAARRLIGLRDLGDALAWSRHPVVVAGELWTTPHMVEVRIGALHASERGWLRRRLDIGLPSDLTA